MTSVRLPTEERQAEIVAAAIGLAREVSPAQITTADIAERVGVTQGALFKHFATKDAIWLAVMQDVQARLSKALSDAAGSAATPIDALGAIFETHVAFVVAQPGVPRLIFHELQQAADTPVKQAVRSLLQGYRRLLLRWIGAAVDAGQLPATLDRDAAATLFIGMVQGLVMQSMLSGKPGGAIATMGREAYAIYLRGIRRAS